MDIRNFFTKAEKPTKTAPKRKKNAPIIIYDDDDDDDVFKPKKSKTLPPTAKNKPKGNPKRLRYDGDTDSDDGETICSKPQSKQSKQTATNKHIKTNGNKGISPKKKAIDSVDDYFGSAPITRSSKPPTISLRKHSDSSPKVIPDTPSPLEAPHAPTDISKSTIEATPTPPKPSRSASYRAYLNREGPKAPGSKKIPEGSDNCLAKLTFVLTGVGESLTREEMTDLIKKYGGKVTTSISRKTSYLVVGEDAGESKLRKAEELKTKRIDEDGLLELIASSGNKAATPYTATTPTAAAKTLRSNEIVPTSNVTTPTAAKRSKIEMPGTPVTPTNTIATPTNVDTTPTNVNATPTNVNATPTTNTSATPTNIPSTATFYGTPRTSALASANTPKTATPVSISKEAKDDLLWVDKYKPASTRQIIGQQSDKSNVKKLSKWLRNWYQVHGHGTVKKATHKGKGHFGQDDGSAYKAALLSGPPGVGKTTTASLVCQEEGFQFIELNASAARSKSTLQETISSLLSNTAMDAFLVGGGGASSGKRHALIMDEVDGMSGSGDRGGVQELISLIKKTQIPVICICNDRHHTKIRSLGNYCYDLRFYKPRIEQIKGPLMSIAYKEGIKINGQAMQEMIQASGQDIRQVLHNLSLWSGAVAKTASEVKKEVVMSPFDVVKLVFMPKEKDREFHLNEKTNLFFYDYSIGPLFVQENYPYVKLEGQKTHMDVLTALSQTADAIGEGDIVSNIIRSGSQWSLLPTQAIFSSIIPGECMRGHIGKPEFPQWLGNNSKRGKCDRILQELQHHSRLTCSCNKREFSMDYSMYLRNKLTCPLITKGAEGIPEVVEGMNQYSLNREDWDNLIEISLYSGKRNMVSQIDSKDLASADPLIIVLVHLIPSGSTDGSTSAELADIFNFIKRSTEVKSNFTRTYNKTVSCLPYTMESTVKRSKRTVVTDYDDDEEENGSSSEDDVPAIVQSKRTVSKGSKGGTKGKAHSKKK